MNTIRCSNTLRDMMSEHKRHGRSVGFVPTMGFLHKGHLSLMKRAKAHCDHLVVSIYVNPLQFGAGEDLDRYPSDPEGDAEKCESAGVDTLFCPKTLFADSHATTVSVAGLTAGLCGASRPGHFDGLATVVARLFGIVQPDIAVFGEKDFQQLAVIRRMTKDLGMAINIMGAPLIRDTDGLALSSRNTNLDPLEHQRALSLHQALQFIQTHPSPSAKERIQAGMALLQADRVDYLQIVNPVSLQPIQQIDGPARVLVAAWIGNTRLIDNMAI
jgi:pantoate--beta-alanine ligase